MLNFPTNPQIDDIFTSPYGDMWYWDGTSWNSLIEVASQGVIGSQGLIGIQGIAGYGIQGIQGIQGTQGISYRTTISNMPPSDPNVGDTWWDSDTGVRYVYYQDIDSYQWVQESLGIASVGPQGIQGLSGEYVVGSQGVQGTFGSQGTQGTFGSQGTFGTQGTQGTFGSQGIQGSVGSQGSSGDGTQGVQGSVGSQGSSGDGGGGSGTQGVQGTFGSQGTQGTFGAQGVQGTFGSQGTQGTFGSQGTFGTQGTQGTFGSQGIQGSVGSQGSSGGGTQGTQGTQGIQGTIGSQGTFGTGSQGVQGTSGSSSTIITKVKTNLTSKTSTNISDMIADPDLRCTISSAGYYKIQLYLQPFNQGFVWAFDFNGGRGPSDFGDGIVLVDGNIGGSPINLILSSSDSHVYTNTFTAYDLIRIDGTLLFNTTGTFILYWGSGVNGGTTSLLQYSHMVLTKLS